MLSFCAVSIESSWAALISRRLYVVLVSTPSCAANIRYAARGAGDTQSSNGSAQKSPSSSQHPPPSRSLPLNLFPADPLSSSPTFLDFRLLTLLVFVTAGVSFHAVLYCRSCSFQCCLVSLLSWALDSTGGRYFTLLGHQPNLACSRFHPESEQASPVQPTPSTSKPQRTDRRHTFIVQNRATFTTGRAQLQFLQLRQDSTLWTFVRTSASLLLASNSWIVDAAHDFLIARLSTSLQSRQPLLAPRRSGGKADLYVFILASIHAAHGFVH